MNPTSYYCGSNQICRLAQISARQLQWWDECRIVSPHHEGRKRIYEPDEALKIAVIAELRRKGLSLQKIRQFLQSLKREIPKRLAKYSELYLLTDGKQCWFLGSAQGVVTIMTSLDQGAVLVDVGEMARTITRSFEKGQAA